jgi:3-oxoacyl-[acyl-carrier protein] reductase
MNIDFAGQCVLVTGAAHGIGRGIVEAFAARGAQVFAADRLAEAMEGLPAHKAVFDVRDRDAVRAWVAEAEAKAGRAPDVLVYVAGGVVGQVAKPIEEVTEADFRAIVDVNLTGAFLAAQAVAPGMKARAKGRIVLIASGAGLRTSLTGIQAYASAKAGEIGLARQLGQELGFFGFTVNAVLPGFQRTNPDTERQWASYAPEKQRALMQATARGRPGTPEDVAHAVLFFASDYADFITGQILSVTGSP